MRIIKTKVLLNRVQYDVTRDLAWINDYLKRHGVSNSFDIVRTDISGYSVASVKNPYGNYQYVLTGAESLVRPYLDETDDICALVIRGYDEFGTSCPSESEDKSFIPGTRTVFLSANADDIFYDQDPNFRIWLLHEIMHALGTIAIGEGFNVNDCMDVLVAPNGVRLYYFLNYDPENVNSNFINMWERFYNAGFLKYQ